jgi:nicotinamide riboside kinase
MVTMLRENNIDFVHVREDDYDTRFLRCIELVRAIFSPSIALTSSMQRRKRVS